MMIPTTVILQLERLLSFNYTFWDLYLNHKKGFPGCTCLKKGLQESEVLLRTWTQSNEATERKKLEASSSHAHPSLTTLRQLF